MPVEVIGIDHVYLTVRDLARAEAFYDRVMPILGYRKSRSTIAGDLHVHFFNRHFGFSLRAALSRADHTGGTIRFTVGGNIALLSGLDVPNRTTIDGSSAPAPGITLLGESAGAGGTGVLNLYQSNVIVRGLRIRNGMNDGIHVVPRRGETVENIVVDHCSITGSHDGGIDITGRGGFQVTDVTIVANYLAGNGGPCAKGMCGGGSLAKYGVNRLSYYYNFWDKNLRRTPSLSGDDLAADVCYNVVRAPVQGGIQIRDGARTTL